MAAGRLLIPGWNRAVNGNGAPIAAAVSLFNLGTDSLATVYADEALTVPLANPVQSNSAGRFPAIWADDANTFDWSVTAPYGPPGSPFTGTGLTTALTADILIAEAAEAAAASAEAALADVLAVEASGSDAAAIAARAAKAANLSDLADLAEAVANLLFVAGGTGATPRSLLSKLRDILSANDHGTLQQTITAAGFLGGEVELPSGESQSVTAGAGAACLTITKPVSIVGKSGIYSAITPDGSTAADAVTLKYQPSEVDNSLVRFQDLYLGNPNNGTRGGGVGFQLTTSNAGVTVARALFDGLFVGNSGGLAFQHTNTTAANPTGGLFCSEWRRCVFVGGMNFDETGDSLFFTSCNTTGANLGVEFEGTISVAGDGPSQAVFINHNSTSEEGAFLFHRARFPTILNANMEQTVLNTGGRMVDFAGDTKPNNSTGIWAPVLANSLVSGFTSVALAAGVRFGSVTGGYVWNNAFTDGGGGMTADIVIDSGASDVWVGPNLSYRTDLLITDNGVGTRGVTKTATLTGSWVAPGNGEASVYFWKDLDGAVHVAGGAKNGTTTAGTVVFTLPAGFRPAEIEYATCACLDGSWVVPATLSIQTNGQVQIVYSPSAAGAGAQKLFPKFTFRAANANTVKIPTPFVV